MDATLAQKDLDFGRVESRLAGDELENNDMVQAQLRIESALAHIEEKQEFPNDGLTITKRKSFKKPKMGGSYLDEQALVADLAHISESGINVEQKMLEKLE